MKFDFSKSIDTDFRNKLQSNLDNISKNVLYLTYQVDFIRKWINEQVVDKGLQKQVDEYFEDDETSPQTDQEAPPDPADID